MVNYYIILINEDDKTDKGLYIFNSIYRISVILLLIL